MGVGVNFAQFWAWIGSLPCVWYELSGNSTCRSKLRKKPLYVKYHRDTYHDDNHSLIMYECILVLVSDWLNWLCHFQTLTNASKKERFVSSETDSSKWSSEDDTMTKRFKNSKWVWSGNTTTTNCRQTHGIMRKSHTTTARHQKGKMIAKLERTQSNDNKT